MSDELTPLEQSELDAMTGDRMSVIRVVSALRLYRKAAIELRALRYQDGALDGAAASAFFAAIEDIET